jgi:hypothetical protein
MFGAFGHIVEIRVNRDKLTGRCKGFGFVAMSREEEVDAVSIFGEGGGGGGGDSHAGYGMGGCGDGGGACRVWCRGERRAAGFFVVMSREEEVDAVSRGGGAGGGRTPLSAVLLFLGAERVNTFVGLGRRSMVCATWQGFRVTHPSHSHFDSYLGNIVRVVCVHCCVFSMYASCLHSNARRLPTGCEQ